MVKFVHFSENPWFDKFENWNNNSYGNILHCASCILYLVSLDWASLRAVLFSIAAAPLCAGIFTLPQLTTPPPKGSLGSNAVAVAVLAVPQAKGTHSYAAAAKCSPVVSALFHKSLWVVILAIPRDVRWLCADSVEFSQGVWTAAGQINSCHATVWLKILMESTAVLLLVYHIFILFLKWNWLSVV